mgnify:CR=1 FL=1|tara:strand:- start:764 stop:1003 length:240 start_codon:yes stop_codon:yes gene_type:complete
MSNNIEEFASKKRKKNKKGIIDKFIGFLPFFIRWPVQLYYYIFKKGLRNPIYLALLFLWFMFMKKTVRTNLEDTYRYKY